MKRNNGLRKHGRSLASDRRDTPTPTLAKAAMRARGMAKIVFVTIAVSQALSAAFAGTVRAIGYDADPAVLLGFNFVSCALVSFWLQADAQRAYRDALASGRLKRQAPRAGAAHTVPAGCPKRWLVILHIELNPHLLDDAR
ncbi:hypothetical protein [Burkholderia sp. TSV86]|uniref:hypothetical protein n=1 Tax=Burkholderia sp. TSV86 TaxID=1385594 RepID=UPI000754F73F|nr:hypothetical protein [Burkholderia sp. TSV86]KVE35629.1 hypothetical protein WS68_06720 [Burkholderia sp. TSV86]